MSDINLSDSYCCRGEGGILNLCFPHKDCLIEYQKSIVVVGVERGGTSMVAGVLRSQGIFFGERTGRNHEDPAFQHEDYDKLKETIRLLNAKYDVWGFKYPRASLTLDFYHENLRNPYYILVHRNIASVVDSWCSRGDNNPVETALHAIEYYSKALSSIKATRRPAIMVNYEEACKNPEDFIEVLAKFIDIPLTQENKKKSLRMITGEGGGYLNIPEHNFYMERIESMPGNIIPLCLDNEKTSFIGKVEEVDTTVFGAACFSKGKKVLPKELYIEINVASNHDFQNLRLYTDFGQGFFSRHSYQVQVCYGLNQFRLLTDGDIFAVCLATNDEQVQTGIEISVYYKPGA